MIASQVSKYIATNNPPWVWPYRFVSGFFYQLYKRIIARPILKKLFNGKTIKLYPDCPISSQFIYTDIPDRQEIMLLRQVIDASTTFIDIGANIGAYSVMVADLAGKIIAFEPDSTSYVRLKDNIERASKHSYAENIALANYQGQGKFSSSQARPTNKLLSPEEEGVMVAVTTLDDYGDRHALDSQSSYVLKIDVEGAELSMLEGAEAFLKHYPVRGILFESFEEAFPKVKAFLKRHQFKIKSISHHNYWAYKDE